MYNQTLCVDAFIRKLNVQNYTECRYYNGNIENFKNKSFVKIFRG